MVDSETSAPQPVSHYFESRGLRLHYVDWGNASAPPLVLVHGTRDHCRSWDWIARELCRDWHVLAPDLRGHGDSARSPDGDYASLTYTYDLVQFLDHLRLKDVAIVGHSLGGSVAINYTALYPSNVRKLVSIEGLSASPPIMAQREAVPIDQRVRDWFDKQRESDAQVPRPMATVADAVARTHKINSRLSAVQAEHLAAHGLRRHAEGGYAWKYDHRVIVRPTADLSYAQLTEMWRKITCPTWLVYATDSWTTSPAKDGRLDYFSQAHVTVYENASHWVHHDCFDGFMTELRVFLQKT